MSLSIIIPAFDAEPTLGECLPALVRQLPPGGEIIVVDDGSTDRTRELVAHYPVRLVTQPRQGPAAARNLGAREAKGEWLLFTDADCVPAPDWITEITRPLADESVSGVKGAYRTTQRAWTARFVQAEYEAKYDLMRNHERIDFVDTYSAAYRRDMFLANQGFDEGFPRASGEDIDFSYRLAQRGYRLVFAPHALVYHQHPARLSEYIGRKFHVGYWRVRMYEKHPGKMIADSHTPQSLKLQMALGLLLAVSLGVSALDRRALFSALASMLFFLLTTVPFVRATLRRDPLIALLAPFFLFVRALALDAGFMGGLLKEGGRKIGRG